MTAKQLKQLLIDVWNHELSADNAWEIIDADREMPDDYSKMFWLPITDD